MKAKQIINDELGTVDLCKRRGNRNIVITVKSHDTVKVTMPFWASYREGIRFVEKNIGWIKKVQAEKSPPPQLTLFRGDIYIRDLRERARKYLTSRISVLGGKYGYRYNKLRFRNARSLWGSCSIDNNITLSIHLMNLPKDLIDYVIVHELIHTVEKNHGVKFRAHLKKIYRKPEIYEKALRGS